MNMVIVLFILVSLKWTWWRKNHSFQSPRLLMYHRVEPSRSLWGEKWVITPQQLESQICWLLRHGWTSYTVSELAQLETIPKKSFALTFDDGFACFAENVLPLLERYKVKATIFCLSHQHSNVWDQPKAPCRSLLSKQQITSLMASGWVELASHGCHHLNLTHLNSVELLNELKLSKDFFESCYGVSIKGFAYPFGHYNESVKHLVQEVGYDYALAVNNRIDTHLDWFALSRITVDGRLWRRWDFYMQLLKGKRGWL